MITRPAPIRFTDLATPVYPEAAQPIRDGLAGYGATVSLTPEAMLAAATARTGLDDYGDPAFMERLEVLSTGLREDAGLSATGVGIVFEQVVGNLVNRLRLQALLTEHPEIADEQITAPIIICGLPRTGTTHLHNLLAADPNLRPLPYWESLEPFPAPEERDDEQPRRDRCAAGLAMIDAVMPEFKRMHDMTVDHAHEEVQLLANDISGMLFETTYHLPGFAEHYRSHDQRPSYAYLKRNLQALQWLRGRRRWVLKSPQHLEQLTVLAETFPDATFVLTHRDPVEVIRSMATMIVYASRMACSTTNPAALAAYWCNRADDLLSGCLRDRDALPPDRTVDIRFDDFMADEMGTVASIYQLAGQPFDDEVRTAMADFLAANPRGRHGGVEYDLAGLGLDAEVIAARLADYRQRFVANDGQRP